MLKLGFLAPTLSTSHHLFFLSMFNAEIYDFGLPSLNLCGRSAKGHNSREDQSSIELGRDNLVAYELSFSKYNLLEP